jgi:hypothetical protein
VSEAPSPALLEALATTLSSLAREVEALGTELAMDTTLAARHLESLQSIDATMQTLDQVALVLGASDCQAALDAVTLDDLRETWRKAA